MEALYLATLAALIAGLVHIVSLLLTPAYADHDAFARVAALAQPLKTAPLPATLPYSDPAIASTVCRYDLAAGPVRVSAPLTRPGFAALSLHSRRGVVFYALTDRAATKGRMEALILTPEQLRALIVHDDEDNPSEDLRIVSPTREGFAVLRALSQGPEDMAGAQAQAATLACASEDQP